MHTILMMMPSCVRVMARRAGRGGILLFALLQMTVGSAFAHAALMETLPADGAMLRTMPADVTLHFNEAVAPLVFKLLLPDGSIRPLAQSIAVENGLKLPLPALAAEGSYLLSWRVVSADGHPVGGSMTYSVGVHAGNSAASTALPDASLPPRPQSQSLAIWLTRLGLYLTLFIGVGAVLFQAFFPAFLCRENQRASPLRWATVVLLSGLVLLPLAVGVQGLDALALPWHALSTWQPWRASLNTAYGVTAWLMLASLIMAGIATIEVTPLGRVAAIVSVLLLATALAASGHASSAPPQWLARPAVFMHGVMIAIWIGSLLPLILLLRDGRPESDRNLAALLRFSRVIPWVLLLLLISGVTLVVLQLDGFQSLWTTNYGRILSAKLTLVLLLLGVAAVNRYALTARVQRGDAHARHWMRRLICVELALALLILALAATWRFTPPPRALPAAHPVPLSIHMHDGKAMLDLTLTAQADRSLQAGVFVQTSDFTPLNAQEVSLQFSNPRLGIEPLQKNAHRGADSGTWVLEPFALPAPGRWHVRAALLISDFERTELEKDIDIAF